MSITARLLSSDFATKLPGLPPRKTDCGCRITELPGGIIDQIWCSEHSVMPGRCTGCDKVIIVAAHDTEPICTRCLALDKDRGIRGEE